MSTRASVIIKDDRDMLFFYQHSDGYPSGLGNELFEFLFTEEAKRYQGDIEYFAAAIIMFCNYDYEKTKYPDLVPAVSVYGDEEYQYIIDCDNLTIEIRTRSDGFITTNKGK